MSNQFTAGLVVLVCVAVVHGEDEPAPPSTAVEAYQRLVLAEHRRPRLEARKQLESFGDEALPYLIRGTKHDWDAVQEACYEALFKTFPDREKTAEAVVRGLSEDSEKIQYTCAFFAGTQKITVAEPALRKIFEKPSHDLRLTAAKSLAQLGSADVIRVLYREAGSDWYMHRYQANVGLKALSGRDLDDFGDYQWNEGTGVISGQEIRMALRPIEDAELRSQRYQALAEFCRWLQKERPGLYEVLDPNVERSREGL